MTNRREQPTYRAVLLSTEGTATPQHFVYEVLQPYAQRELKNYLERHWNDPQVQEDLDKLVEQAAQMPRDAEGCPTISGEDQSNLEAFRSEVIEHIEWQWENKRELPSLHALQGQVWANGLQQGRLKMELFDDVEPAMEAWDDAGVPVFVLSSNVESEKLLYQYTDVGDLTGHIDGFLATADAQRTDPATYRRMAEKAGIDPGELLFVTDRPKEAAAARKAGLLATVVDRPGRPQGGDEAEPNGEIPHVHSLRDLVQRPV